MNHAAESGDRPASEKYEIEITPEMIAAGADVICVQFSDVVLPLSDTAKEVAKLVFLAMILSGKERSPHALEDD